MTQLSPHLTLEDFIKSATADRLGIDNSLPDDLLPVAINTATNLFEPVRALLGGVPLPVDSGWRCSKLNIAVRGVPTSQHAKSEALDLKPKNMTVAEAFDKIKNSNLIFDQLICETSKASGVSWIHVSLKFSGKNRQMIIPNLLKQDN